MTRREAYIRKIEEAYHEFLAASVAVDLLEEKLRADPSFLTDGLLRNRAARGLRNNLEGTYLIRLFAAFEAGIRDAWEKKWRRATEPPVKALINAVAALRTIQQDLIDRAHEVREYRNGLIHEEGANVVPVTVEESQKRLCEFMSKLPKDW